MTITELDRQAEPVTELEKQVETDKRQRWHEVERARLIKRKLLSFRSGRLKSKPTATIPDYHGLVGAWADYLKVAQAYVGKVPTQDRDDVRHDIMLELDRATKRDGKPLPELRAYRIASLCIALYYRELNRFSTRVCVFSGKPIEPRCKGCPNKTEGKRCVWLAVRPVESLDSEILDPLGYRIRLLDTVASDKVEDMPDKWYDLDQVRQALPLRLVEIGYRKLEGKPLSDKDRQYLSRYRRQAQKALF